MSKTETEHHDISFTSRSMMDDDQEYYYSPNYTRLPNGNIIYDYVSENISSPNTSYYEVDESPFDKLKEITLTSIVVICILGAVGNGIVIWLLGFRIKRNPFITYILNLAVADFGLLVTLIIIVAVILPYYLPRIVSTVFLFLFLSLYSTGQFLLTAISIDRCVAVFFPLWHRCHRPPRLSTIVCALIWVLSTLLSIITIIIQITNFHVTDILDFYQFIVNAALCLPLTTISTTALFVKVCFRAQQRRRGKLLTIILLALIFFLFLAFPLNVILIFKMYTYVPLYFEYCIFALPCLNSSVNPLIYFLVGRQRKSRHSETLKLILQRVFKEEEGCKEELQIPAETQL